MALGLFDLLMHFVINYAIQFGYFAIFAMIVLGSFGIPIPEELILLVSGYLSSLGVMNIYVVIIVATIATIVADNVSYWIGRKKGVHVLRSSIAARIFFSPRRLSKIERYFKRHGGKTVLIARFLLGFRMISFIFAGSSKMPWIQFQKYNVLGAIIWVPFVTLVGYFVSSGFIAVFEYAENVKYILLALFVILVAGYFFLKKFKKEELS